MNKNITKRTYQSAAATLTTETTTTYNDVLPCNYSVCLDCARIRCAAERLVAQANWKKTSHLAIGLVILVAVITGFSALGSHQVGVFLGLSDEHDLFVPFLVGCVAVIISMFAYLAVVTSHRAIVFRDKPSWFWAAHSYGGLIATKLNRNYWMSTKAYEDLSVKLKWGGKQIR